jgi:uncharacterized protein (TIGR02271 family)
MLTEQNAREVIGTTAYSADGDKIGKVGQLFLDDQTGRPEFVTVNTGLFGTKETFIPVADATFNGDRLTLPYSKERVKDAPNVDAEGGHLDEAEEQRLYQYYEMSYDTSSAGTGFSGTETTGTAGFSGETRTDTDLTDGRRSEGHDTSGPTTDDAMTRSEESLRIGKATHEAGRVRLRKYVTSETETHTVPVTKERAVIEREPITDANIGSATSGPELSEEEHEIVLNEEHVTVDKTVTPVERVRLGTETVTDEQTVTEEVRKEHIETEGAVDADGTDGTFSRGTDADATDADGTDADGTDARGGRL